MAEEAGPAFVDTWSSTMSNTIKLSHKWTINNFSFYWQKPFGEFIESPTFPPKGNSDNKWCLRAYPNGWREKDYFSVHLRCVTSKISNLMAKFKIYFTDVNNIRKNSREASRSFVDTTNWGFPDFIEKQSLLSEASVLLPNDNLTIVCEIEIINEITEISEESKPLQVKTLKSRMNDDFWLLFETREFTDVTLAVDGKDIHAHKMMLAARSSVFFAMFVHDMQESRTNRVEIKDVLYNVFMEMLRFIYTDKAPNLESMALELLAAADKYALHRLKSMCAEALCKKLDTNSIVDILVVSHLHRADELKALAINFVFDHTKNLMTTAPFEKMAHSHPDLLIEILRAMSTREIGLKSETAETK